MGRYQVSATPPYSDLLTAPEVARLLRVAQSTVRKWIAAGSVPFVELPGGDYRIPRMELVRRLRSNVGVVKVLDQIEAKLLVAGTESLQEGIAATRSKRATRAS